MTPLVKQTGDSQIVVSPPCTPGVRTKIEVGPGTEELEALNEQEQNGPGERRATSQIFVQSPTSGGLTGKAATVANLTAVGFVMMLTVFMYRDFSSTVKERDGLIREEMRLARDESKGRDVLIREEMKAGRDATSQTSSLLVVALQGVQTKTDAMVAAIAALTAEIRAARIGKVPAGPDD